MAIVLIRHGETPFNARRVVQFPDTPLSERGREQARRVGERMRALDVASVLSSDYLRARETADAIVELTGAPRTETPALRERFLGDLQGRHHPELGLDFHAPDFDPPGGECPRTFAERIERAWEEVVTTAGQVDGHLAVVTHGLVLHALARQVLEMPPEDPEPRWPNTCVTVVDGGPPWMASLAACTAHLDGEIELGGIA